MEDNLITLLHYTYICPQFRQKKPHGSQFKDKWTKSGEQTCHAPLGEPDARPHAAAAVRPAATGSGCPALDLRSLPALHLCNKLKHIENGRIVPHILTLNFHFS